MKRELSFRTLALIAVALATATGVFCYRWAARYSAAVERQQREILSLQLKHDQVESWVLKVLTDVEVARAKSRNADEGSGGTNPSVGPYLEAIGGPQRDGANSLDRSLALFYNEPDKSAKAISDCGVEHDGYPTSLKDVEPEIVGHREIRKRDAGVFP